MQVNLPAKYRLAIYIISGVGSVVVGYLKVKQYIGDPEVTLWFGVSAFANTLAALNVNSKDL